MKSKLIETKFRSASRLAVHSRSIRIGFIALIASATSAWAGTSALEGVAKDATGHPIKGADVQIEAKNFAKVVKTDRSGHYISNGLAVGTYKVTLVVNGSVTASMLNAKTQLGKTTQLNFDLTAKVASPKKHTHLVYCPTETGTLIGGLHGRWIEVDDNGTIVNNTAINGFSSVDIIGGEMQGSLKTAPGRGHGTFSATLPGN